MDNNIYKELSELKQQIAQQIGKCQLDEHKKDHDKIIKIEEKVYTVSEKVSGLSDTMTDIGDKLNEVAGNLNLMADKVVNIVKLTDSIDTRKKSLKDTVLSGIAITIFSALISYIVIATITHFHNTSLKPSTEESSPTNKQLDILIKKRIVEIGMPYAKEQEDNNSRR